MKQSNAVITLARGDEKRGSKGSTNVTMSSYTLHVQVLPFFLADKRHATPVESDLVLLEGRQTPA